MPSTHSMITRSRARRGQSSSPSARLYSFITRVPGPSAAVESSQGKFMDINILTHHLTARETPLDGIFEHHKRHLLELSL